MSGKLPLFAAAPRLKILIGGLPVAYAVGLEVSVSTQLQEVRILGEFAIASIEPVMVAPVSGSFQIVRLMTAAGQAAVVAGADAISSSLTGNPDAAIGNKIAIHNSVANSGTSNDFGQDLLFRHIDPRAVLYSQTFDIEMSLKVPRITLGASATARSEPTATGGTDFLTTFLVIKDCRITSSSMNLSPAALLTQTMEFQGLLLQNTARPSGAEGFDTLRDGIV